MLAGDVKGLLPMDGSSNTADKFMAIPVVRRLFRRPIDNVAIKELSGRVDIERQAATEDDYQRAYQLGGLDQITADIAD